MKRLLLAVGLFAELLFSANARATLFTFTNETAFNSAIGSASLTTEGFNSIGIGFNTGPLTFGPISVNTAIGLVFGTNAVEFVSEGPRAIDWLDDIDGDIAFTVASPINAFAIDIKNLGTAAATTLSASVNDGAFFDVFSNVTGASGNLRFLGLFDNTANFSSVALSNTADRDFVGLDRLRFGTVAVSSVSEPSSFILAGVGLLGVLLVLRQTTHA